MLNLLVSKETARIYDVKIKEHGLYCGEVELMEKCWVN
jgi:hypothetical protein